MNDQPTDTGPWKMPDWMKLYTGYFRDTGALSVETLMNTYGGKCVHRIIQGQGDGRGGDEDKDVVEFLACIANAQVGLLTALKGADLLRDVAGPVPGIHCPKCNTDRFVPIWKHEAPRAGMHRYYYGCRICGSIFEVTSNGVRLVAEQGSPPPVPEKPLTKKEG